MMLKTCPTCGSKKLLGVCEDVPLKVHGQKVVIPAVSFQRCPNCGEELFDLEASRKIDAATAESTRPRHRRRKIA
jgi:YgiT-type zinc finger domain-containing protein